MAPQSDEEQHDDADKRLRRALTELRGAGIDAHGQVVHPDPYTAARHVVIDERVDEIIVSTFPGERSGWLRRDLLERLKAGKIYPADRIPWALTHFFRDANLSTLRELSLREVAQSLDRAAIRQPSAAPVAPALTRPFPATTYRRRRPAAGAARRARPATAHASH